MESEDLVNWLAGEPTVVLTVRNGCIAVRVTHNGRLVKSYDQSFALGGDPEHAVLDFQGAATSMTRLAVGDLVSVAKGFL
jgi:hypothetical protein